MKIAMVHSGVLNTNTGGGIHTYELFKNFQIFGDVTCFIARSDQTADIPGMIKVPFANIPLMKSLSYFGILFFYLLRYSLKNNPDIIYVRKATLGISPLIVSKVLGIPYILEVNGLIDDEIRMLKNNSLPIRLMTNIDYFHFRNASMIIAVAQGLKDQIIRIYSIPPEKIIFIENGVNPDMFYPIKKEIALSRLSLKKSEKYICFVGGLAPWHGVEYLVQIANDVVKEFPDVRFLIVGDGPMREPILQNIEKLNLSKKFILTGNIEQSLVPLYINASEFCVAPFTGDRNLKIGLSPLKIYEYLACGKPVVASNISGVSDIILKSGGGILVKPDDLVELKFAIIALLKETELRERMGEEGYKFVSLNHTWSNTAERTFDVFKKILQK